MNWKHWLAALAFWGAAATIAEAADVPLTEAQVRSEILGKDVSHGEPYHLTYFSDGKFGGGDGRFGWSGTYRLEKDGRICWKIPNRDAGCFQYYRRDAQLRVRRTDQTNGDIGSVTVSSFKR